MYKCIDNTCVNPGADLDTNIEDLKRFLIDEINKELSTNTDKKTKNRVASLNGKIAKAYPGDDSVKPDKGVFGRLFTSHSTSKLNKPQSLNVGSQLQLPEGQGYSSSTLVRNTGSICTEDSSSVKQNQDRSKLPAAKSSSPSP